MAHLISGELVQINLTGEDWVKMKKEASYWDYIKFISTRNFDEAMDVLISRFIKEWSLKDERGVPIPCTRENILRLDPDSSDILFLEMSKLMDTFKNDMIDKKKLKNSTPPLNTAQKQDIPTT